MVMTMEATTVLVLYILPISVCLTGYFKIAMQEALGVGKKFSGKYKTVMLDNLADFRKASDIERSTFSFRVAGTLHPGTHARGCDERAAGSFGLP